MTRLYRFKSNFTGGEIAPSLYGRADLRAYENGAARLRNVVVHPTGGVSRRPGTRLIDSLAGGARLVPFAFNDAQSYLLVFKDRSIRIYRDGVLEIEIADTQWQAGHLDQISWAQSADTLLIVHPHLLPKKLIRLGTALWKVEDWTYAFSNAETGEPDRDRLHQPFHKFADDALSLTPSAIAGTVTLTASESLFVAAHEGIRFRLADKEVLITAVNDAQSAQAEVKETLSGTDATTDWQEQVFSQVRGWPVSVAFHQDRLVIGGSRDLPQHLWLSKSSELFNFDLGEGLDDEAISFPIHADRVNGIRAVHSGRNLEVFTEGAEWMVGGIPLTPENAELRRQTRQGSRTDRSVPPLDVDGATFFVRRDGEQINEFLFADVDQAYSVTDLGLLAGHLANDIRAMTYLGRDRLLFAAMGDGSLGCLTQYRAEQVTAWSLWSLAYPVRDVCVVDESVYLLAERGAEHLLLVVDPSCPTDATRDAVDTGNGIDWTGLDALNGETVQLVADGRYLGDSVVSGGGVSLAEPEQAVSAGLAFRHQVTPLPPMQRSAAGLDHATKLRLINVTFRLRETAQLAVDSGRGLRDCGLSPAKDRALGAALPAFSGDLSVRALGWRRGDQTPLWRVEGEAPLPLSILSVTEEIKVND